MGSQHNQALCSLEVAWRGQERIKISVSKSWLKLRQKRSIENYSLNKIRPQILKEEGPRRLGKEKEGQQRRAF
jgi:hypothetical protein